jgi:hypothetical protein
MLFANRKVVENLERWSPLSLVLAENRDVVRLPPRDMHATDGRDQVS